MFNNKFLSDIKFIVFVLGESESKKFKYEIFVYKFFLLISSFVFYIMFYGVMLEIRENVELFDCNYEVFVEFLCYIYCDEIILSESNVFEVLYMLKKYMMFLFVDGCWEFLVSNMFLLNVFSVLLVVEFYEEEKVVNFCWKMIDG